MPRGRTATPKKPRPTTRLYISPLAPHFLNAVLPPQAYNAARNVEYHEVATFPEKAFGYLELPEAEAERVRKRLNGSVLKGQKMVVEVARKETRPGGRDAGGLKADSGKGMKRKAGGFEEAADVDARKEAERAKRAKMNTMPAKRGDGLLGGVELPEGRHVKRGWTHENTDGPKDRKDSKHKKDEKSKDEGAKEHAIMRTTVPPNKDDSGKKTKKLKSNKEDGEKRTKRKPKDVKEFAKTETFPSFLRQDKSNEGNTATEYVDGKGWIDEAGNVIEAEKPSRRTRAKATAEVNGGHSTSTSDPSKGREQQAESSPENDSSSVSESSSEPSSSSDEEESEDESDSSSDATSTSPKIKPTITTPPLPMTHLPSGSPTPALTVSIEQQPQSQSPAVQNQQPKEDSKSNSKSPVPPEQPTAQGTKEIHPLESLFKRPAPATSKSRAKPNSGKKERSTPKVTPIDTSFSFSFDDNDNEGEGNEDADINDPADHDEESSHLTVASARRESLTREGGRRDILAPPATPYTRRDIESRGVRSAAPTPDTAAIGKRFVFPWGRSQSRDSAEDGEDNEDGGEDEDGGDDGDEYNGVAEVGKTSNGGTGGEKEKEQTEFEKQFYAHRGEFNRDWKARKREAKREGRRGGRAR